MQIAIQPVSMRLDNDLIYSLKKQILSKFFGINAVVLNPHERGASSIAW